MTPRRTRGFTLIELLAATALFALLGTMLFQVITGAMDLWSRGERVRDLEERAGAVLDLMTEDLRHVWAGAVGAGEQEARFLVEWREEDRDGDGFPDRRTSVLRFTRLLHEARSLPWLRRAGETPAASGVATLTREEDPAELQPTSGLAESLYATAVLADGALPVLVRRVRTPVGGAGSLMEPGLLAQEDRLLQDALLLADRVLYFGVRAWGPDTTVWEITPDVSGEPALMLWDSTRGGVEPGDEAFPYGRGATTVTADHDDMFPPAVQIELVLDPFEAADRAPAALAEAVGPEATRLVLDRGALGGDDRVPDHLWIEGEWLAVSALDGRVVTVERGARGSVARDHGAGTPVRVGRLFRRVVRLPAAREGLER